MSNPSNPHTEAEIKDACADIQLKLGIDDNRWLKLFGNTEGLYGFIAAHERQLLENIEKAYGGCHKCYGKGYATVRDGTIGYSDFGGEGFKTPITTKMKFCSCERGTQLSALIQAKKQEKK